MATIISDIQAGHVKHRLGDPDRAAAVIAERQLGVITFDQLAQVGIGRAALAGRAKRGVLTRLFRGVYLWGALPGAPGAYELAACLACGPSAYASHGSAAALWELAPPCTPVHVTVVRHCRSRPGLQAHRGPALESADISDVRGIPVTAPARTLLDVAASCAEGALASMLNDAFARRLVTEREVLALLGRSPGRTGAPLLRALIDGGPTITRSHAERLLLRIVRAAGLPTPRTNVKIEGKYVDAYWPDHKLIVEIDGYAVHGHRQAFESDRATDQRLIAAGYRVMRITWRQLTEQPIRVAAHLAAALRMRL